ncbi:MAG: GDP-mannose 4,6-dehydratase [Candidatus Krumholzibacteria bacterium]|nr:GDP-mannose 4,6-dehydratase [Candidatus Krumholzibacteria bacterium]
MSDKALVTGAAGFIGSHLCERLVSDGWTVTGIDSFTDYYDPRRKRMNISGLASSGDFTLVEEDLNSCQLARHLEGVSCVFHLAAQAGVRRSWGAEFSHYIDSNILATQKLLEAMKDTGIPIVYSSSSSVYGDTRDLPMREEHVTSPVSPYGATKLSAEHLCELYRVNFGVRYAALRYFTVFGPRQRPDMAFSRFIMAALGGGEIEVYGDGKQTRDFTFVLDAVEANVLASRYKGDGRIFNIGGGSRSSVLDVIEIIRRETGGDPPVRFMEKARGDVLDTWADTSKAARELGFKPTIGLEEGLKREVEWYRNHS